MVGEEVWEEWTGQEVEGTEWREGAKDEWEAKERAVVRGNWLGVWIGIVSMTEDDQLTVLEKGEPWLLLAVVLSHFYPLLVI